MSDTLLSSVSNASSAGEVYEYIQGGALTEALSADVHLQPAIHVHLQSAIDHLGQAQLSPEPRARIMQSVGDLQVVYFAYSKATSEGIVALRRWVDCGRLGRLHDLAAGSAATVALLQWHLDEHPQNLRNWLDRVARHLADNWRWARSLPLPMFADELMTRRSLLRLREYCTLETNLLPAHLARPRPLAHQPGPLPPGTVVSLRDPSHVLPEYRIID